MSYSAPHTFAVGEVATAANLNLLSNDVAALVSTTATVDTSETTTSTTYADLATVGPAQTINTGDRTAVLIMVAGILFNSGAANATFISVAVSGATTLAANDVYALRAGGAGYAANLQLQMSLVYKITGLTAGSNTFTCKYKVSAGTGTFIDRKLTVGL